MRLPFPEHVPFVPVFFLAILLCGVQLMQGTDPTFSLGCFSFLLLATAAFNVGGGFTRPSGGYVFFYSMLTVIIGILFKAVLGEPADSNLQNPILTIKVFVAGITMMLLAVFLSTKLKTKHALLGKMVTDSNMQTATVGCMITGIALNVISAVVPGGGNGSVLSAINQINRFFPMAIILGVIHTIRRSGGTRSTNLPVLVSGGFLFFGGIIGYSKEGIITPFLCWTIAAASQRYRMSRSQICGGLALLFFIFQYLVPYAQYGRAFRGGTYLDNIETSFTLLTELGYVRQQYLIDSSYIDENRIGGYYDHPEGFFDRLEELSIDDALIEHTRQFGTFGYFPIIASFENLVPHIFWPDKPSLLYGNVYAHEIGILGDEDTTTGISFSPTAEAYHLGEWRGIFLLAPALWLALFTVFDSLCGDVRLSPWGLLAIVTFGHMAPEGGVSEIAYALAYVVFGIVFAAVMGAYLMPILGTLFVGPEGITIRRGAPIRSIPNRLRPPVSSET
ncbi:MAG TPA: hypothetical protein VHW70_05155 [Edaphobacter sp.]|nr:hypothetical protein [Edaphobacter sp.]